MRVAKWYIKFVLLIFVFFMLSKTFSTITVTPQDGGKILLTASDTNGFTGQGVFAYLNFNLIATAPGSTQICTLWAPTPTPTVTGATPVPTRAAPTPTALPQTGNEGQMKTAGVLGIFLATIAGGALIFMKKSG